MAISWHIRSLRKSLGLFLSIWTCLYFILSIPANANTTSSGSTIPFERLERGQYTIEVRINDSEPLKFMIDTAATRSSIFNKTRLRLGLEMDGENKFINGMTNSGYRPSAKVKKLSFGRNVFLNHTIIILEDWKDNADNIHGVLGMDVFKGRIFAFSHKTQTVEISKHAQYSEPKYKRWKKIRLDENPYPVEKFGLLFTHTKLGDLHVPTLLDTGSSFSAINWMSVSGTKISKERRRLREEWLIQGAVGTFKPRLRIILEQTRIGGVEYRYHNFLVMNFDNLPVNNYGEYPLVIAGIDIMEGRDFTLDFINNTLYIAPKPRKRRLFRSSRLKSKSDE